jgi:hypothetical protein
MAQARQDLENLDVHCLHIRHPEIQRFYQNKDLPDFTKGACKIGTELVPVDSTRCELCAAYGSLSRRQPSGRDKSAQFLSGPEMALINKIEFDRVKDQQDGDKNHSVFLNSKTMNATAPWTQKDGCPAVPSRVQPMTRLKVAKGQFGEMYHILVCAILIHDPKRVQIDLSEADPEKRELFEFYAVAFPKVLTYQNSKEASDAKSAATGNICAFFEQGSTPVLQVWLFEYIQRFMTTRQLILANGSKYAGTDYSAKYWINRFLLLTGRSKLPKPPQRTWHATIRLYPKDGTSVPPPDPVDPAAENARIAVINIRRTSTGQTTNPNLQPRAEMTNENLKSTIQAILAANVTATKCGSPDVIFTHIILYGDIGSIQEARDIIKFTEDTAKASSIRAPVVYYITAPWRTLKVDAKVTPADAKMTSKINDFWANFQGDEDSFLGGAIDSIPSQVKIINIYLALQRRYDYRLCIVGFRSGFLEAAGFFGIPIFYMNETNIDKFPDLNFADGQILWNGPYAKKIGNRLGQCSSCMNTFIAVDVPGPKAIAAGKGASANSQGKRQTTAAQGPKATAPGKGVSANQDVELNSQGRRQLMAALYMYMLSAGEQGRAFWESRVGMMNSGPSTSTGTALAPAPKSSTATKPQSTPQKTQSSSSPRPKQSTSGVQQGVDSPALGAGQKTLKERYETCEALWTVSNSQAGVTAFGKVVQALVN